MSDRAVAGALVRIQKAKRSSRIMKRARGMGLMSHPASKYGVRYVPSGTSEGIDAYGVDYRNATEAQRQKRKADGYYGRGEYWGKMIGGALGRYTGIPGAGAALSHVGDKVGDWFKRKFTGRGLYEGRGAYSQAHSSSGSDNSLIAGGQPSMKFHGEMDETSGLTLSHTEFVGDIYAPSSSTWSINSYALNPGLQDVFPQLSQFALNFEEYEFIQLVFHYRSTVDASSTTNASGNTGTIILATDYSCSAQNFKDKAQMVSAHGAIAERITEAANHGIECDPTKNMGSAQKSVRAGLIRDRDVSTLDLGKFQIAFQNTPAPFFNQQVGELWVTYTVKLDKPRIFSAASGNVAFYKGVSKGGEAPGSLLGTNFLTCLNNSIPLKLAQATAGSNQGIKITFPAALNGVFEIVVAIEGSALNQLTLLSTFFTTTGNVFEWKDIYTGFPDTADSPSNYQNVVSLGLILVRLHCRVSAASGGVDNSIVVPVCNTTVGTQVVNQCSVECWEINPFVGQSDGNPAPIYVDSLGVITAP